MAEILKSRRVILRHFLHRADHVVGVLVRHAVKHRQADQAFVCSLGHGEFSASIAEAVAVVRMEVNGNVVHVDADVLGPQRTENFGPADLETR